MRRFAWGLALVAFAALPVVAVQQPFTPPPAGYVQLGFPGQGVNGGRNYQPPKADGPVVELLDEGVEPLFPVVINDGGGEPGTITREDRDVFAGVEAVRITPLQKYRSRIPGWNFRIVEKPGKAGEFRYLRFAWKKVGGPGIMLQLHDPARSWFARYYAGQNAVGWQPAKPVSDKLPTNWEVVTCDLFKDHGTFTLSGIAFTAMYGDKSYALFDHVLLGRSVEDLDKATDIALGRIKPAKPVTGKERDALWTDLMGSDSTRAAAALRAFLATSMDQVDYIGQRLKSDRPDPAAGERIQQLIADLDDDRFETREAATDTLIKIGAPAIDRVRALLAGESSDEVRYRARMILKKLGGDKTPLTGSGKMARVARILERAGSRDARNLLKRMADGEFGADATEDARAALARVPNLWKR